MAGCELPRCSSHPRRLVDRTGERPFSAQQPGRKLDRFALTCSMPWLGRYATGRFAQLPKLGCLPFRPKAAYGSRPRGSARHGYLHLSVLTPTCLSSEPILASSSIGRTAVFETGVSQSPAMLAGPVHRSSHTLLSDNPGKGPRSRPNQPQPRTLVRSGAEHVQLCCNEPGAVRAVERSLTSLIGRFDLVRRDDC